MTERTLRGKTVIAGIGETTYYKHGQSPDSEFKLALQAILAAAKDAGIDPKDIELVVAQASCTRAAAVAALKRNDMDIVNAIMDLTMT